MEGNVSDGTATTGAEGRGGALAVRGATPPATAGGGTSGDRRGGAARADAGEPEDAGAVHDRHAVRGPAADPAGGDGARAPPHGLRAAVYRRGRARVHGRRWAEGLHAPWRCCAHT